MIPSRTIHPARLRRAFAEAHEIAYRDAHRRRPLPDNEFFDSADAEIAEPRLWAKAPFWIAFLALAGFVAGLLIGHIDQRAAIDFLAPTAAQARDAGWVTISEAL
ncbi:hypothetical protein F8A10_07805 [Paracoccus kondratievae]|uniref:hypothetical protein n=1 Tax=Paracoccus kondratievae TaxID=135740 RepID=UPI0012663375|nr:hypothetical protein [Paracoccus kondratievae]QFQ87336.1 hypothetical protein F8A10_07805 [Paracoccus kondratievae]